MRHVVAAAVLAALVLAPGVGRADEAATRWAAVNAAFPAPAAAEVRPALEAAQADCPATGATLGVIEPATAWPRVDEAIQDGVLANAWTVTIQRADCPPRKVYARYLLTRDAGGVLAAQLIHVGRSYVDLDSMAGTAMTKAMRTAGAAAARDIPGCSLELVNRTGSMARIDIVEDSAVGPDSYGLRRAGTWREAWVFAICGRTLTVQMDFQGHADGLKATPAPWASLSRE